MKLTEFFTGFHFTRHLFLFFPQVHPKELNNGIINAAFMILFKDLVKLFASYNDGIINLLGEAMADNLIADLAFLASPRWIHQ